jgi:Rrf2 family protein
MLISRTADYAVRVVVQLASLPARTRLPLGELAEATAVPKNYAVKVVQRLVRVKLVKSWRGTRGGVALAVAPDRLSMLDVIEAIDGPIQLNICVTPGMSCERRGWCPAHLVWIQARDVVVTVLRHASVADLARQAKLFRANWDALNIMRGPDLVS